LHIFKLVRSNISQRCYLLILTCAAGGGIVFDSDPYEEWMETINKLRANIHTIESAEKLYTRLQRNEKSKT
jgi:anthranilate/para-aminobenzoate synthase component I